MKRKRKSKDESMECEHGPEVGHNLVAKNINIFERFRDNEDTSSAFPIFI